MCRLFCKHQHRYRRHLDAYGDDVPQLLQRWSGTMLRQGVRIVHLLASPEAHIRHTLSKLIPLVALPYTRTPYYLTAKPLCADFPARMDDFAAWNLIGSDVL